MSGIVRRQCILPIDFGIEIVDGISLCLRHYSAGGDFMTDVTNICAPDVK